MAYKNKKRIACDKRGRPLPPSDVSPRAALMRAAVVGRRGAAARGIAPRRVRAAARERERARRDIRVHDIHRNAVPPLRRGARHPRSARQGERESRRSFRRRSEDPRRGRPRNGDRGQDQACTDRRLRKNACARPRRILRRNVFVYAQIRLGYAECSVPPAPGDKVKVYYEPSSNLGYCVELPGE